MKRLIKLSDNVIDKIRNEVLNDYYNHNNTNMTLLNTLDSSDVKIDKCPQCRHEPIIKKDGYKVCPHWSNVYKILGNKTYLVLK